MIYASESFFPLLLMLLLEDVPERLLAIGRADGTIIEILLVVCVGLFVICGILASVLGMDEVLIGLIGEALDGENVAVFVTGLTDGSTEGFFEGIFVGFVEGVLGKVTVGKFVVVGVTEGSLESVFVGVIKGMLDG